MTATEPIPLTRDVPAAIVPAGDVITLKAGEPARITQELGGTYTVMVHGNLFRIDGRDADALGREVQATTVRSSGDGPANQEDVESQA